MDDIGTVIAGIRFTDRSGFCNLGLKRGWGISDHIEEEDHALTGDNTLIDLKYHNQRDNHGSTLKAPHINT